MEQYKKNNVIKEVHKHLQVQDRCRREAGGQQSSVKRRTRWDETKNNQSKYPKQRKEKMTTAPRPAPGLCTSQVYWTFKGMCT